MTKGHTNGHAEKIRGTTTSWRWDDSTRTATTSVGGRVSTVTRDAAGRVVSSKDGLNRATTFTEYSVDDPCPPSWFAK